MCLVCYDLFAGFEASRSPRPNVYRFDKIHVSIQFGCQMFRAVEYHFLTALCRSTIKAKKKTTKIEGLVKLGKLEDICLVVNSV